MKRAIAIVILFVATSAAADTIPFETYVSSLEEIRTLLAANQIATAQDRARALSAHDVDSPHGTFHADTALLADVAKTQRGDMHVLNRLDDTLAELRAAAKDNAPPADPKLLRRVAVEQDVPDLVAGGDIAIEVRTPPLIERVAESIRDALQWLGEKLQKLFDWILDFFPGGGEGESGATGGMRWMVTGLVVIIVLLIVLLAIEVMRRSRASVAKAVAASVPIGSKRDEDPLSRGANEWERYAAQLASAGRFREAIRAWYHAVLVTCYSAGILHYRKSRTNWEYVASLAPSVPWRAELIQLTQRFEREWYGADQSSIEAFDDCSRRARSIIDAIRIAAHRGAA